MKIKLITERTDASIGLRLAGIETVCKHSKESLTRQLGIAAGQDGVGVLLITPGVEKLCGEAVNEIRKKGRPLLVTVPDSDSGFENTDVISEYVRNAIGIKLD